MAQIQITITAPDNAVPLVRRALASHLGEPVSTTAAQLKTQLEAEAHRHLKQIVRQQKQQEAAQAALVDDTDGVGSW